MNQSSEIVLPNLPGCFSIRKNLLKEFWSVADSEAKGHSCLARIDHSSLYLVAKIFGKNVVEYVASIDTNMLYIACYTCMVVSF